MKCFFTLIACLFSVFAGAQNKAFVPNHLKAYYAAYFCREKSDLAAAGVTNTCLQANSTTDPIAPEFKAGYLPIVLVNNSGLPDSEVYVLITGDTTDKSNQVWGVVDTNTGPGFGLISLRAVEPGDNSTTYSYLLSQLPETASGRVIYSPEITSGIVWFSMKNKLSMTVNATPGVPPNTIVQPNFTNPSDSNYSTNYDIFEYTFLKSGSPQVSADATAVSFFSIPLVGYLPNATTASSHTGLTQNRSYIMSHAASVFTEFAIGPAQTEWNKLFLTQSSTILRLLSTGKSISASAFDANYLDDSAAYGYSYLDDIWTGVAAYYKQGNHDLSMTVVVTKPATASYDYTGNVQAGEFVLTSSNGGPDVTFPVPVTSPTPTGTTTFDIFSAINFITPLPAAGTAGDATSKLLQEAIVAGLVPTTDTLSLEYLSANQGNYYKINDNLKPGGKTTGPWYDLYSKALHELGSIYTYGFDEPLWPTVLIGAPFIENSTYLGITIGSIN